MPWQIASFIAVFLTLIINTTCPYFRKSRHGILISHWMVIPFLKLYTQFNYFLYIFLTIGTINFIRTPVFIGGFVQSVKNIGTGAIELFNKRKQINQFLET
uniref:Uncharacterized protein n=1 Tax=Panagrolaimus sp. ES5 TaxID=591445 RepID=A0AC34G9N8_9BILA